MLGILVKAYTELAGRLDVLGHKGAKSEAVKVFIRNSISNSFAIDVEPPAIQNEGRGPAARWRRLHSDF